MTNPTPEIGPANSEQLLADYLADLTSKMPASDRKAFAAEARAHLVEFAGAFEALGHEPVEAMRLAIEKFGAAKPLSRALTSPAGRLLAAVRGFFDPCGLMHRTSWIYYGAAGAIWAVFAVLGLVCLTLPPHVRLLGPFGWRLSLFECSQFSILIPMIVAILPLASFPSPRRRVRINWQDAWLYVPVLAWPILSFTAPPGGSRVEEILMLMNGPLLIAFMSRSASRINDRLRREMAPSGGRA